MITHFALAISSRRRSPAVRTGVQRGVNNRIANLYPDLVGIDASLTLVRCVRRRRGDMMTSEGSQAKAIAIDVVDEFEFLCRQRLLYIGQPLARGLQYWSQLAT